jgi:hypothetical protein
MSVLLGVLTGLTFAALPLALLPPTGPPSLAKDDAGVNAPAADPFSTGREAHAEKAKLEKRGPHGPRSLPRGRRLVD